MLLRSFAYDDTPAWAPVLAWGLSAMAGPGGSGGGPQRPADDRDLSDMDLVALVQQGDTTAFRGLVERFQSRIYSHVYGMIRNREEARDLTQETFVKAFRNMNGFRGESSFTTWLYRIASNVTIDHIRKHSRMRVGGYDDQVAIKEEGDGRWEPDHLRRSPGRDLERQQLYQRVMDAMQTLPPDQRQVVLLREIEGFSYKEIAEAMGIPEGTVMSRLFYARKRLQAILKDLR
ncbi:MAG: sigma-70 family RNA polymerase sigma factor [Pseudomonadota bacterium]